METSNGIVRGKVSWFDTGRGLGFIERFDGEDDVYVFHKNIKSAPQRYPGDKRKNLFEGQIVQFEVVQRDKGPAARNVVVVSQ